MDSDLETNVDEVISGSECVSQRLEEAKLIDGGSAQVLVPTAEGVNVNEYQCMGPKNIEIALKDIISLLAGPIPIFDPRIWDRKGIQY